ncbi:hypothetical protein [Streptomyces sp. NPDC053079]|uniref:hypothetical protein n=1 Tax=Streptomyces sp. NPDC053079 TaxID=3365697 RepID=UPI0037D0594B
MTTSFRTRAALGLVTAAVGGTLLTGCGKTSEDTASYTVEGQVASLRVKSAGGSIELVGGSGNEVKVTEKLRYSDDKPKTKHHVDNGVLTLTAPDDCGGGGGFGGSTCEVSYRVEIPKALAANLRSDGGGITVSGGVAGRLTARSDGGSITVGGFPAAPESVDVSSSGGDVTLRMPAEAYAVDAATDGGSQKVDVKTDPASGHRIKARSDGGRVSVISVG